MKYAVVECEWGLASQEKVIFRPDSIAEAFAVKGDKNCRKVYNTETNKHYAG